MNVLAVCSTALHHWPFVRGIHWCLVDFPHRRVSNAIMNPLDIFCFPAHGITKWKCPFMTIFEHTASLKWKCYFDENLIEIIVFSFQYLKVTFFYNLILCIYRGTSHWGTCTSCNYAARHLHVGASTRLGVSHGSQHVEAWTKWQ